MVMKWYDGDDDEMTLNTPHRDTRQTHDQTLKI
jgi:hypothetical protein